MKVTVRLRYPEIVLADTEKEIEIPDGEDPQEWIDEHEEDILREDGAEDDAIAYACDIRGGLGVTLKGEGR